MKELSIEEKAQRYDEAIEKARKIHNEQKAQSFNVMLKIFPELKESENEIIRKDIIQILANTDLSSVNTTFADMLAYLEKQGKENPLKGTLGDVFDDLKLGIDPSPKQGESKPIEPTDLKTWKYIVDAVLTEREGIGQYIDSPWTTDVAEKLQKRFGNIEQKPAWSEEDEKMLNQIIEDYERGNESWLKGQGSLPFDNRIKWLKSLRPQSHWKPSGVQMKALRSAIHSYGTHCGSDPLYHVVLTLEKNLRALLL